MKNTVLATLAFFSVIAFAPASAQTPTKPAIVAQLANPNFELSEVKYYSDGTLVVTPRKADAKAFLTVSRNNRASIEDMARMLSTAETIESFSQMVCMMMPGPRMGLSVAQFDAEQEFNAGFGGTPRLVQKGHGCAFHDHLDLAEDYDQKTAAALVATLQTLANQAVSQ